MSPPGIIRLTASQVSRRRPPLPFAAPISGGTRVVGGAVGERALLSAQGRGAWLCSLLGRRSGARKDADRTSTPPCSREKAGASAEPLALPDARRPRDTRVWRVADARSRSAGDLLYESGDTSAAPSGSSPMTGCSHLTAGCYSTVARLLESAHQFADRAGHALVHAVVIALEKLDRVRNLETGELV